MKLISVETQNILRCKMASVRFDRDTVIIGGDNGEGKSSFAKSIWMAFGGKEAIPDNPVTDGEECGSVSIELDQDMVLTRKIYPDRRTTLELTTKAGAKYSSPQRMLDAFNVRFGYWPQAFIQTDGKEQAKVLRDIAGIDTTKEDTEIERLSLARLETGRKVKALTLQLGNLRFDDTLPVEEVSIAELAQELKQKTQANMRKLELQKQAEVARYAAEQTLERLARAKAEVARLEAELASAEDTLHIALDAVSSAPTFDIASLQEQLQQAQHVNRKIWDNKEYKRVQATLTAREQEWRQQAEAIRAQEAEKKRKTAEARMPLDGLGFGDTGVTYKGHPFQSASSAQQWEVAIAIAFALNPKLKLVYIEYGSLLDKRTMGRVRTLVEERGGQLLVEVVGDQGATVVFEDGVAQPVSS